MLSTDTLKAAGFKEYKQMCLNGAERLWQKKVVREDGKVRYFIDIFEWDFPSAKEYTYSVEVALFRGADEHKDVDRFTITLGLISHLTPAAIEAFIANVYHTLKCIPNRDNN